MLEPTAGPPRTYRGKRAGVSEVTGEGLLAHPDIAKKLTVKEIRFMDEYVRHGSVRKAWQALHPKAKDGSAAWNGGTMRKKIMSKITQDEFWELWGPSLADIGRVAKEGLEATFKRSFITRDGQVIETPSYPDHDTRQKALANAMKIRRIGQDEGAGAIQVNIVMYNQPGDERWPTHADDTIDVTPEEA